MTDWASTRLVLHVLGCLVVAGTQAFAADWAKVGKTSVLTRYVDRSSMQISGTMRYYWARSDYPKSQKMGRYRYTTALAYIVTDCSTRMSLLKQIVHQNAEGETLGQYYPETIGTGFEAQPPDTIGAAEIAFVCAENSPPRPPQPSNDLTVATGSGFAVSTDGLVLTNAHVAGKCSQLRVTAAGATPQPATLLAMDERSDLALLKVSGTLPAAAEFRKNNPVRLGEEVTALGFPLHGLLASGVTVSSGTVSALAGIANDTSNLQISAPVQPGNSGGPLLDASGAVIGVVVAKLDALKVAQAIGDIPQNVNFAIKGDIARLFLEGQGVVPATAGPFTPLPRDEVAAIGREFTVLIECLSGVQTK